MKIAVAAYAPDNPNQIVGMGTVGVGDGESIRRTEVTMRDPADPLKGSWLAVVQFDPPVATVPALDSNDSVIVRLAAIDALNTAIGTLQREDAEDASR